MSSSMAAGSTGLTLCVCWSLLLACCVTAGPMVRPVQQQHQPQEPAEVLDPNQLADDNPLSLEQYFQVLKDMLGDLDDEGEDDEGEGFHRNSLDAFENDMQDTKRFDASTFMPSRGKKWNPSMQVDYGDDGQYKRFQPGGFIATRGKKNVDANAFLGARGRRPSASQFHGARGKRTRTPFHSLDGDAEQLLEDQALQEELETLMKYFHSLREDRYADDDDTLKAKRQPPTGFHALRGKRDLRQ